MSGSILNRGGAKFEFFPEQEGKYRWRIAMRYHTGLGTSPIDATKDLIEQIETELATAKASCASLIDALPEPHPSESSDA